MSKKDYTDIYKDLLPSEDLKSRVINAAEKRAETVKPLKLKSALMCASAFAAALIFSVLAFFNIPRFVNANVDNQNDFYISTAPQEEIFGMLSYDVASYEKIDDDFIETAKSENGENCALISFRGEICESAVYLTDSGNYGILGFIEYKIKISEIYDTYNLKKILPANSVITVIDYLRVPDDLNTFAVENSSVYIKAYTGADLNPQDASSIAIGLSDGFVCYAMDKIQDSMPNGK